MKRIIELDWYKIWSAVDEYTACLKNPHSLIDTDGLDGSLYLNKEVKEQIEQWVNNDVNSEEE